MFYKKLLRKYKSNKQARRIINQKLKHIVRCGDLDAVVWL